MVPSTTPMMVTGCVTPSPALCEDVSSTIERNLLEQIKILKAKNDLLNKQLKNLDDSHGQLALTVETLTLEMRQLKFQESGKPMSLRCGSDDDGNVRESSARRKRRVQIENAKFSHELSILIHDFITSSSLADRRKFPTSRLAKIVIDGILSFEWTHLELANFSSTMRATGGQSDTLVLLLSTFLNVKMKRYGHKSKAALLVDCMWDNTFLDGEVKACMINRVRSYLRSHVYSPWKILRAMDLAGFTLSLAGIEVLRGVDVQGKYKRSILPSKSTILRTARKLEAAANRFCPFTMIGRMYQDDEEEQGSVVDNDDTFGEGFEFDSIKVTQTLFEAFGLLNVAKQRPVELGLTSDGAQLTNTISHVAAGLKLNDVAMCNPVNKCPLLLHEPDSLVQSRNLCFPLRIVIAKDSKKTLDGFRPLYNMFNSGEVSRALQCHSFKMSFPGDMKLQWGALDNGGAAKVKEKFCYICPCRSSTLHVPQDKSKCVLCKEKAPTSADLEERHCYHYSFLMDPNVRQELVDELGVLTSLRDVIVNDANNNDAISHNGISRRKMYVRRPGQVMIEGDTMDIDNKPSEPNNRALWSRHITDELGSRGMAVMGTLSERQQRLRERLVNEQRAQNIACMLTESEPKDRAMYLVLQAVVCILHLENRVGLKSIESILRSGVSNARKGILEWTVASGVNRRQEEYVDHVTKIIQTQILGSLMAPSQWRFPLTEEGNVGTLSMDNNRTRSVMNFIELLIEVSFPNSDDNKRRLLRCFPRYRAAIIILRKDTDATLDEINTFQDHIDAWFQDWVIVYGKEGCTNYTHMLSSSHVMRYMQEWKCLHRFSQQGWEALNALIKSYFFRRTNRGGLSKNATKKSKLLGIARWLQRRIMWYSGKGDFLFEANEEVYDDDDDSSYDDDSNEEIDDDSRNSSTAGSNIDEDFELGYVTSDDDEEQQ